MAKRRNDSGCGLAVLALAIIFVLGKCAGDADDPTKPSPVLHAELPEPPTATMYVSSANLNCRATPSSSADSCEEAYHYLNDCGVGRLDGDGDGVPCESICG